MGRSFTKTPRSCKTWTKDEEAYLRQHWGQPGGVASIAKALDRSVDAVKVRAVRLRLGAYINGGTSISFCQLHQIVTGTNSKSYSWTRQRWQSMGLPIHKIRIRNSSVCMVDIEKFWKWAYENRASLDFSHFPEYSLGKEPAWVR